jgi:hypothetical protein
LKVSNQAAQKEKAVKPGLDIEPGPTALDDAKRGLCGQAHLKARHHHITEEFLESAAVMGSFQCEDPV